MKIRNLTVTLAICTLMFGAATASAGNYVRKTVNCPQSGVVLILPGDGQIRLEDILLSSTGITDVTLQFYGAPSEAPNRDFLKVFLTANSTFVSNFQTKIESDKDQGARVSCSGTGTVSVTLVGSRAF